MISQKAKNTLPIIHVSEYTTEWKQHNNIDITLRKHAYSNILKFSPPKTENF